MINNGLATLIRALLFDETVDIAKVQPPDGVVLRLADGTRWSIQAYRLRDEPVSPVMLDPDCRIGKHRSCVGDPCRCECHAEAEG